MNGKKLNIGLFGFGTVGSGLYDVLKRIGSKNVEIKRICVRDISKKRAIEAEFTNNPDDIFNDPEINFIVELIDDAEAAYTIVKRALQMELPVVSGNKKMLAHHIEELIELQARYNVALLYDASACGSIPVIRNLEEYYDNDLLTSVKGILNGSSNFILSKIFNEKMSYSDALKLAQDLGFAESNPTLDIDGWDSLFKLIIITIHAFGLYVSPEKIFTYGISNMSDEDIRFANEKERRFKLVAHVEKVADNKLIMSVMPQLISHNKYIYSVEDEFNGVVIKGLFYDKQFMFGRGAGGYPTGSAVLSDITACLYDYKYEYKKRNDSQLPEYTTDYSFRVYYRYQDYADLDLIKFESVSENYISDDYKYVVGKVSLRELHKIQDELRRRNVFIAAYPND
ncbi:MAG: homoserine dehydrogenase [Alistipes sp.]|jgi:homoserine dehydrogenase|nr:homoserine dehydrogenase [Alistipes sp.]MBQ1981571.1 homoserine dehydrogenase [Alistipes sp.]MBQ5786340.1 homoserine dehydrogenase [Alistipes sp.]MBQ5915114.1 homoserine dehydrogenase [Alistipes sp.]